MTIRIIKQLRRLNAGLLVAMVCSLSLAIVGCRSREAAATATGPVRDELKVGNFWLITGTGFSMANAYRKSEAGILDKIESDGYGSYDERRGPVHNILLTTCRGAGCCRTTGS